MGGALDVVNQMPLKTESRCHICQSSLRPKVDKLIAAQFSYVSIAEELIETEDFKDKQLDTVRKNVERHAKRHLDIRSRAIREIVEKRAAEQGILVDSTTGSLATTRGMLDLMIAKGTEQMSNADAQIRMADAIEAAKMLEDIQRQEYLTELERLQRQVYAISQAVKELPEHLVPGLVQRAEEIYETERLALEARS